MERDRKGIGLTQENIHLLAAIEERKWFADAQDIARFCLGYAIRANVPDGVTVGTETRWTAGLFDPTGEIRALVEALYPQNTTPVRLMEHLVNVGLGLVSARLRDQSVGPADLFVGPFGNEPADTAPATGSGASANSP
jgi:hypothetical protein